MRDRRRRVAPFESVICERQRLQKRRDETHRMNRRTDVVHESGKRQLGAARAAADRLVRFENQRRQSGARENDRGRESVRSGADNHRVISLHHVNDMARWSLRIARRSIMSKDDKLQRGDVTDYRPNDDTIRGDKTGSVQKEALGAEGGDELASGPTSGRINSIDRKPHPKHEGGENPSNRGLTR